MSKERKKTKSYLTDPNIKAYRVDVVLAIHKEKDSFQQIVNNYYHEIGVMVTEGQYEEEILKAKIKNVKWFSGIVKGLETSISILNKIRRGE